MECLVSEGKNTLGQIYIFKRRASREGDAAYTDERVGENDAYQTLTSRKRGRADGLESLGQLYCGDGGVGYEMLGQIFHTRADVYLAECLALGEHVLAEAYNAVTYGYRDETVTSCECLIAHVFYTARDIYVSYVVTDVERLFLHVGIADKG